MAAYNAMTDQQRAEWHRKNDARDTSGEMYSPNSTYKKAINYK
jgi:hypothetical protein